MKNIFFINGTMGVGKTATSRELQKLLPKSVFLDGDWCWDMHPFVVTDETISMVEDNISYILNNFLKSSEFENIIFCWVMHEEQMIKKIQSRLNLKNTTLHNVSLICSEESLIERLSKDIEAGIRTEDIIERSIARMNNYSSMSTDKINVSNIDSKQAAQQIIKLSS